MSRFTQQDLQAAYGADASYTLPRFVTMIVSFNPESTASLFPMTVVKPLDQPGVNQQHGGLKWVRVRAFRNPKDYQDGWIPKSIFHDFAYASIRNKVTPEQNRQLTGATYGGDKVDYDTDTDGSTGARKLALRFLRRLAQRPQDV